MFVTCLLCAVRTLHAGCERLPFEEAVETATRFWQRLFECAASLDSTEESECFGEEGISRGRKASGTLRFEVKVSAARRSAAHLGFPRRETRGSGWVEKTFDGFCHRSVRRSRGGLSFEVPLPLPSRRLAPHSASSSSSSQKKGLGQETPHSSVSHAECKLRPRGAGRTLQDLWLARQRGLAEGRLRLVESAKTSAAPRQPRPCRLPLSPRRPPPVRVNSTPEGRLRRLWWENWGNRSRSVANCHSQERRTEPRLSKAAERNPLLRLSPPPRRPPASVSSSKISRRNSNSEGAWLTSEKETLLRGSSLLAECETPNKTQNHAPVMQAAKSCCASQKPRRQPSPSRASASPPTEEERGVCTASSPPCPSTTQQSLTHFSDPSKTASQDLASAIKTPERPRSAFRNAVSSQVGGVYVQRRLDSRDVGAKSVDGKPPFSEAPRRRASARRVCTPEDCEEEASPERTPIFHEKAKRLSTLEKSPALGKCVPSATERIACSQKSSSLRRCDAEAVWATKFSSFATEDSPLPSEKNRARGTSCWKAAAGRTSELCREHNNPTPADSALPSKVRTRVVCGRHCLCGCKRRSPTVNEDRFCQVERRASVSKKAPAFSHCEPRRSASAARVCRHQAPPPPQFVCPSSWVSVQRHEQQRRSLERPFVSCRREAGAGRWKLCDERSAEFLQRPLEADSSQRRPVACTGRAFSECSAFCPGVQRRATVRLCLQRRSSRSTGSLLFSFFAKLALLATALLGAVRVFRCFRKKASWIWTRVLGKGRAAQFCVSPRLPRRGPLCLCAKFLRTQKSLPFPGASFGLILKRGGFARQRRNSAAGREAYPPRRQFCFSFLRTGRSLTPPQMEVVVA